MLHTEAIDGRRVVTADFLLFRVEANALPDYGGLWTCCAPDGEGHLKADCQDALPRLSSASTECMFPSEFVGRGRAFVLWWDVTSHILDIVSVDERSFDMLDLLKPCILASG